MNYNNKIKYKLFNDVPEVEMVEVEDSDDVYSVGDFPVTLLKYLPKTYCDGRFNSSLLCCIDNVVESSIDLASAMTYSSMKASAVLLL